MYRDTIGQTRLATRPSSKSKIELACFSLYDLSCAMARIRRILAALCVFIVMVSAYCKLSLPMGKLLFYDLRANNRQLLLRFANVPALPTAPSFRSDLSTWAMAVRKSLRPLPSERQQPQYLFRPHPPSSHRAPAHLLAASATAPFAWSTTCPSARAPRKRTSWPCASSATAARIRS